MKTVIPKKAEDLRVLMFSSGSDARVFENGSFVQERMKEYATIFKELHIVVTTVGKHKKQKIGENLFLHPTNSGLKIFYSFGMLAQAFGISKKIDVVTAQDPFETGFIAWIVSIVKGAKLQLQVHTDFLSPYFKEESFKNTIRVTLARFLLPKADGVRVVSDRLRMGLMEKLSIPAYRIIVLPIVPRDIHTSSNNGEEIHKKFPQCTTLLLMASRLAHEKDITTALLAFRKVVDAHPLTGLLILGDGPEKETLQKLAKNLSLEGNVFFLGWQNNPGSYYNSADIFLSSSLYEGFGLSVLEAGLHGLSIVTTDVGLAGDILKNGESAFVCPVLDSDCLAKALIYSIENKEISKRYSVSAQIAIRNAGLTDKNRFLEKFKDSFESLYSASK